MNKFYKFFTFSIVTLLFVCSLKYTVATANWLPAAMPFNVLSQVPIIPNQATPTSATTSENNFLQSFILAVVSAILGFLASLILETYKKKREPHKQLSYNIDIKKGILKIEKDIESKINVLYNNHSAKNLYYLLFDLENTGNRNIQAQEIRFKFPNGTDILDSFYDPPKPESEMQVEELKEVGLSSFERKYRIGYIERGKKLGFRFIVAGSDSHEMKMDHYPKNEKDEVDFISRIVSKTANESDTIKYFLMLLLIFIGVPPSLEGMLRFTIFDRLTDAIVGIVRLLILIFMLQKLEAFVKAIVDIASNMQSKKGIHIDESHIENLVIQGDESQGAINVESKS